MYYARIETPGDVNPTAKYLGEQLETELEKLGFQLELPTAADWGHVFRVKTDNGKFDISVKLISTGVFGVGIENTRDIFSSLKNYLRPRRSKGIKSWIEEILSEDIGVTRIQWFTSEGWAQSFGTCF